MKKTGQCPKCESRKLIIGGKVTGDVGDLLESGNLSLNDLALVVEKDPGALFFTKEERFNIQAWVCGGCGYTEFYTDDADKAYRLYDGDKE